jgi:hypothetical protein
MMTSTPLSDLFTEILPKESISVYHKENVTNVIFTSTDSWLSNGADTPRFAHESVW